MTRGHGRTGHRGLQAWARVPFALVGWMLGQGLGQPGVLPAQAPGYTFVGVSGGVALKADYGLSESEGFSVDLSVGRMLTRRTALRIDAEVQRYGVKNAGFVITNPCPPQLICTTDLSPDPGDGTIATVGLMANAEWYEQPGRGSFYLLGGAGPQLLVDHPDRPRSLHCAVQAGAGIAVPVGSAALRLEARYQRALGGGAQPPHAVAVSLGLRLGLGPGPQYPPEEGPE